MDFYADYIWIRCYIYKTIFEHFHMEDSSLLRFIRFLVADEESNFWIRGKATSFK